MANDPNAGAKPPGSNWHGIVAAIVLAIAFSAIPIKNAFTKPTANKDYSRWWDAAQSVRAGEWLIPPGAERIPSFIYPPASAVLFYTPLSLGGNLLLVLSLVAIGAASLIAAVAISVYYARGRASHQPPLLYIVPVAVCTGYLWDVFYLGQPNLMLLAMLLGAFVLLDRGRWAAAGTILGFAAMLKAFPATALGYLIWRRHFKAAAAMVVATVAFLVVLPAPIRGWERHTGETAAWLDLMLFSTSGETLANQPQRAFRYGNQSLMSVVHRLTRPVDAGVNREDATLTVNLIDVGSRGSFLVFLLIVGALGVWYVLAMPPRDRRTRLSNGLEYAILLLMIPLFSPKAGTYYFCWAIPGLVMVLSEVLNAAPRSPRRRWLLAGLGLSVGLMLSAATQMLGGVVHPDVAMFTQAAGATCLGSVVLLIVLLSLLWTHRRGAVSGKL